MNISPLEIDEILLAHEKLLEGASVGVPDPIYGEEVVCYVAPKAGQSVTAEQVLVHCSDKLPAFRMPKQVIVRDRLPKTERGKMHRVQLLDEWKAEFGGRK
jgi:acyl-coenzyme A synthetase/AMP-(fatty) acid ligase